MIKKYVQATMLSLMLLLSGCTVNQLPITDPIPVTYIEDDIYTVTEIPFEQYADYESKGAYNGYLSLIEIIHREGPPSGGGHGYLRTGKLLRMDLSDGSVEEINIEKEDEANRLWDFVKLDDDKILYTEISYVGAYLHYKTILQDQKKKTIITEGNWPDIFSLPQFSVINNTVYFLCGTVDYVPNDDNKNSDYRLELWRINEDSFDCIYHIDSKIINGNPAEGSETLLRSRINTNNNTPSFLTTDNESYYLNKVVEGEVIKQPMGKKPDDLTHLEVVGLDHIVPIGNYQLATFWREDIAFPKNFNTYLYNTDTGYVTTDKSIRLADYCSLAEWTVAYSELESDTKMIAIRIVDQKIEIKKIPEVRYGSFFRKIDDNSLLIFNGLDKCYRVDFK